MAEQSNSRGGSRPWIQRSRDRLAATRSMEYIEAVNNGDEKPDPVRLQSCWKAVDKLMPNPPTATHELDADEAASWQLKL